MKRLSPLFPSVLAQLAFWRKPAGPDVVPADSVPKDEPADRDAPTAAADETRPGWLTRISQVFRRHRPAATEAAAASDDDEAEVPAASHPSFLARLIGRLRRRPVTISPDGETDETIDENRRERDEAAEEGDATQPRGLRRMWAIVSRKRIWIPAASVAMLALIGTLGVLLWQATHEQALLQAKLHAAEQELERASPAAGVAKAPVVAPRTPTESPVTAANVAAAPPAQSAGGDCDISSREGVSLRLKDCIDAFNQETTRAGSGAR